MEQTKIYVVIDYDYYGNFRSYVGFYTSLEEAEYVCWLENRDNGNCRYPHHRKLIEILPGGIDKKDWKKFMAIKVKETETKIKEREVCSKNDSIIINDLVSKLDNYKIQL